MDNFYYLSKSPILEPLGPEYIKILARSFREQNYPAGASLLTHNRLCDSLIFVKSGILEIIKYKPPDSQIHSGNIKAGEFLFNLPLFQDEPFRRDVLAKNDVCLLTLSRSNFESLMREHPELAFNLAEAFYNYQRKKDLKETEDLKFKNALLEHNLEEIKGSVVIGSNLFGIIRQICQNAPFFIFASDRFGKILWMNCESKEIFRKLDIDTKNASIKNLFDLTNLSDLCSEVYTGVQAKGIWSREMVCTKADNEQIFLELTAISEYGLESEMDDDRIVLFFGQDLTSRKLHERNLISYEHQSIRGDLVAEISHELNNYLLVVTGNLELLKMDLSGMNPDPSGERFESLDRGINRVIYFLDHLAAVPRPEMRIEKFDLESFINEELHFIKSEMEFSGIDFACRFDRHIPKLEADKSQLRRMLKIIFDNALDALEAKPSRERRIRIDALYSEPDNRVIFQISDNGCGMSPENYKKAFIRHFTTKKTGHGFDLLAIKKIIKNHNGKISASPSQDEGTIIKIELPLTINIGHTAKKSIQVLK